jgi:hypothetical protein
MDDKLCQSEGLSCVGCCYDVRAYGKEDLVHLFRHNRNLYKELEAGRIDAEDYETAVKQFEINKVREVCTWDKKCHFVGFLDDGDARVGCLAHPKANHGKDLRDKGQHASADFCGRWSCYSEKIYTRLTPEQRKAFRDEISGYFWYQPMNTNEIIDLMIDMFGDKKETRPNKLTILLGGPPFHGW